MKERAAFQKSLARAVWVAIWLSTPAAAQHGYKPPDDRAFHERLDAARVVAFATVDRVEDGRVFLREGSAILGEIEAEFAIKRAPGAAPPWLAGERALLFLAGARSPYRWTDRPAEVQALRIADAATEARWRDAVLDLSRVRDDPRKRRAVYTRWCDGQDAGLRAACLRALLDPRAPVPVDAEGFFRDRSVVALDTERSQEVRIAAARLGVRHPAGAQPLLRWLMDDARDADLELATIVLEAGLRLRNPDSETALALLLRGEEPGLRAAALRVAPFARGPQAEQALAELAVGHSDEGVREQAMAALKKVRGRRASTGS